MSPKLRLKLTIIDCADVLETSDGSSCIGMSSIAGGCNLGSVTGAEDKGIIMLKDFMGRFKTLR